MTRRSAWLLVSGLLFSSSAHGLTFEAALELAARRPHVEAPAQAQRTRAVLDGTIPGRFGNPEALVGVGVGNVDPGFRTLGFEFQSVLTIPWALQDLAGARTRTAQVEREGLAIEALRRRLEQQRSTARAWWGLWSAQQLLRIAQEEHDATRTFAEQLARAEAQGVVLSAETLEAQSALAEAAGRVLDAESSVVLESNALATATGVAPAPAPTAEGTPPTPALPAENTWPSLLSMAGSLPEVQAQQLNARAASLLAVETAAMGTSWLTMGVQAQRNSGDQWQLYGLIGVRWSAFDRNQRAHGQASTAAQLAQGAAASAQHQAQTMLALVFHDVEHDRSVERLTREQLLPASERLLEVRELALRRGAGTVFDVLRARTARLRARMQLVIAEGRRRQVEFDAWLLLASLRTATRQGTE